MRRVAVKKSVVGVGKADKDQVQAMIKISVARREAGRAHDAADALAVAITHAHHRKR